MFGLSVKCLAGTIEKLRTCVTPLVIPVRFRYWADKEPTLRRWGFKDKMEWRGALPRLPTGRPLPMPPYAPRNAWSEKKALFGQNDYIDILGDGSIHPVKISYNIPVWLRGFKGNEYQMLIRKRKWIGHRLASSNPEAYRSMEKRMRFLYKVFNYRKKALMTRDFAVKP